MAIYTSKVRANNRLTRFWSTVAAGNTTNPANIPNMMFRYRGDSITGSNGSDIATWADTSGHSPANDLSAHGGAGNRPVVQTNALNGFTAMKVTAGKDAMVATGSTVPTDKSSFTVYCVIRFDATGTNDFFGWQDGSGSGVRVGLDGAGSAILHYIIPNVGDFVTTSTLNIAGNWNRISIVATSGVYQIQIGSSTVSWTGSPPSGSINGSPGGIQVGMGTVGGRGLVGQIVELLGYNRGVTADELSRLDSYAKSTYGIS